MKFSLLKLSLGICLLLGFSIPLQAQLEDPVDWKFEIKQVGPDEHEIHFKASIEPGWHLYSQYIEPGGPIPTSFNFETVDGIEVLGKAKEVGELHRGFDETFKMDVAYFSDQGTYVQRIKRLKDQASAQGYLEYMVYNDQKCLPPTAEDFSFTFTNSFEEEKTAEAPAPPKAEKSPAPEKKVAAVPEKASQTPQVAEAPAPAEEPLVEIEETTPAPSGILQPVSWDFAYEKIDDETYQLLYTAKIEDGWKVYSQFIEPGGPIPTAFEMEAGAYEVSGEVAEKGNIHKSFDEVFKMDLAYFEDKVVFVQKVKAKDPNTVIKGSLLFMTCNDEKCLPPDYVDFAFNLSDPAQTGKLDLASLEAGTDGNPYKINTIDLDAPAAACTVNERETEGKGLLTIFLLGFGGGLLALLTPCVFPMIPITVGFFTKSAEGGRGLLNAIAYGSFIFLIYTALSIPFHLTESVSSDIFNEISTNMWLNLAFFAIFLIFAISFLGYFEITLPSKFTNRMQSASSVGGMLGIFFLALVLALVSFSCTGPILGTLLVGALSSDGGAMQLTAGLAG
ncbi:MAG: protein-disulfide reductase DsbD domain-containing protein, partial [Bacteroidota bacterium]